MGSLPSSDSFFQASVPDGSLSDGTAEMLLKNSAGAKRRALIQFFCGKGDLAMMGAKQVAQGALSYEFSIEDHVPPDHLLRAIDRFVELGNMRQLPAPFYNSTGRPSVDPGLMIRMLIVGYAFAAPRIGAQDADKVVICSQIVAVVLLRTDQVDESQRGLKGARWLSLCLGRQDTATSLKRYFPRRTRDARISTLGSRSVRATGGGGSTRPVKLATAIREERTEYSTVNTQSRGSSQYCPITAKLRAPCGRTSGRSPALRGMNWLVM